MEQRDTTRENTGEGQHAVSGSLPWAGIPGNSKELWMKSRPRSWAKNAFVSTSLIALILSS